MEWILAAIALVLVALAGWFAAVDSAISVLSRADLLALHGSERKRERIRRIADNLNAHVVALSFTRILFESAAGVLVTMALVSVIDQFWVVLSIAIVSVALISFVLVSASPRTVGRVNARQVIGFSVGGVRLVRILVGPVANLLDGLGRRLSPSRERVARSFTSEDQLLSMVDDATEQNVIEEDDRELIHSIIEFNHVRVREIMIPRTEMIIVSDEATIDEALRIMIDERVSRMPVYHESADQIVGILYLREMVRAARDGDISVETPAIETARDAVFVPETLGADRLLARMQLTREPFAIVIDEYGGVAGLVSIEDVLEELVGDISDGNDRRDVAAELLSKSGEERRYRVSAKTRTEELGELFEIEIEDEDVDTVGGLLAKHLSRIPARGDHVRVHGIDLLAERVGRRGRIQTVIAEGPVGYQSIGRGEGENENAGDRASGHASED